MVLLEGDNSIKKEDIIKDGNKILGNEPKLINSKIQFVGKNNVLYCEDNVVLRDSTLNFKADNSIIYLSSNKYNYILNIDIYNNSILYFDENNYFNGRLNIIISETKNVFVGRDNLFSFGIWIRLADPHIIYDCIDKNRMNFSKSVYIGDHTWIGQNAMILKGTKIGSGSVIGAMSLVSGKTIPSNTIWGGNPSKQIRKDIFFLGDSVHKYTDKETKDSMIYNKEDYIYEDNGKMYSFNNIELHVSNLNNVEEKLAYTKDIRSIKEKNRFFVGANIG